MSWEMLAPILVFLLATGLVVPLAKHMRINPMVGLLLTGVMVGPHGVSELSAHFDPLKYIVIKESDTLHTLAEFGVMSVLFVIGLEFSLKRLVELKRYVLGMGMLQVLLSAAAITAVALQFENSTAAAVIIGASLALSSTAMVSEIMARQSRLQTETGKASIAVLLAQDLAVVPLLVMVPLLAGSSHGNVAFHIIETIAIAIGTIAGILLLGRVGIRPLLNMVARTNQRELMMGVVLLLILGLSMGTYAAGLSAALGAFLAGLMVAETPYRHSISVDLNPFRGLLVGVFFMTVGMQINVAIVLDNVAWLLASVLGIAVIKAAIMFPLLRSFGVAKPAAAETSLNLAHGGEFAFVILGMAMSMGVLPDADGHFMLLVAALSMFMVPVITHISRQCIAQREHYHDSVAPDMPTENHALIIGFGRFGQEVARALNKHETPYIAIEKSAREVERARQKGFSIYHGDGSHCAFLDAVGLSRARLVVIALETPQAALQVLTHIRTHYPKLPVFARARDAEHAAQLKEKNSCVVIEEGFEAALELATTILKSLEVPDDAAEAHANARREDHYKTAYGNA